MYINIKQLILNSTINFYRKLLKVSKRTFNYKGWFIVLFIIVFTEFFTIFVFM